MTPKTALNPLFKDTLNGHICRHLILDVYTDTRIGGAVHAWTFRYIFTPIYDQIGGSFYMRLNSQLQP